MRSEEWTGAATPRCRAIVEKQAGRACLHEEEALAVAGAPVVAARVPAVVGEAAGGGRKEQVFGWALGDRGVTHERKKSVYTEYTEGLESAHKCTLSVMPDAIRHPEPMKTLDSGFRRNDDLFGNLLLYGQTLLSHLHLH